MFQASALQSKPALAPGKVAIATPALGRVAPVDMSEATLILFPPPPQPHPSADTDPSGQDPEEHPDDSFWPLVRLEVTEALVLAVMNGILILIVSWMAGASIARTYGELWHFLLPLHFAISWSFVMVPLTLVGQSPVMGHFALLLDSAQPERRIAFSLFHLISVLLFPLSFFCMVLTPFHRTLAEFLTGQEILIRPQPRMR